MIKTKIPNLVTILVLTVLTIVTWISLNIYRAITTEPAPVVPNEVSEPLDPNLDQKVIEEMTSKVFLEEGQIPTTVIVASATPEVSTPAPSPTATAEASASPEASATPTTEGGTGL